MSKNIKMNNSPLFSTDDVSDGSISPFLLSPESQKIVDSAFESVFGETSSPTVVYHFL